ncbi:hypothetical protein JOB18_022202 [Solea senegalensis]|uniref:Uncharacterized protein n=1 Tax=Solea senegalensis TaxID=28829 RepID=A0AAV6SRM2_SOLSE|nr:hypothetical protein JOB18_022202 [Solea senegalensis]
MCCDTAVFARGGAINSGVTSFRCEESYDVSPSEKCASRLSGSSRSTEVGGDKKDRGPQMDTDHASYWHTDRHLASASKPAHKLLTSLDLTRVEIYTTHSDFLEFCHAAFARQSADTPGSRCVQPTKSLTCLCPDGTDHKPACHSPTPSPLISWPSLRQ